MDFFTTEALFSIHLETRQVNLAGFTPYPDKEWMEEWGCLRGCRYLLHDRDARFCQSFRELIKKRTVNPLQLPARSLNPKSYAGRWGEVGQRRMFVEANPIWRIVTAASVAIYRTFP
jgi:hypothetical protein